MYWKHSSLATSQINTLLDSGQPVTLAQILNEEDVIQECKNQNQKLVDFLCDTSILSEMISLITTEPSPEAEESTRFKNAHVAAELLTCEVQKINEKISSDQDLLQQLYTFVEWTPPEADGEAEAEATTPTPAPPLNPLLASFFTKAFTVLITRKSEQNWYSYQYNCVQVFEFLKKKPLVKDLLAHIGTSAISDLILRLITCVEGTDIKQSMLNWLDEKQLIQSIMELLDPKYDRDTHDNASRLLVEILRVSRDGQFVPANERCNDPLLNTLEEPDTVAFLLDVIFRRQQDAEADYDAAGRLESSLVNGLSVLMALLESKVQPVPSQQVSVGVGYSAATFGGGVHGADMTEQLTPEEVAKQKANLDATIAAILPRMEHFTRLLTQPPRREAVKTTAGVLDPPLGATRLNIAKLISALLATNHHDINVKLKELNTIDILLDLFFKYSLNNFLHAQVEQCISHVFNWNNGNNNNEAAAAAKLMEYNPNDDDGGGDIDLSEPKDEEKKDAEKEEEEGEETTQAEVTEKDSEEKEKEEDEDKEEEKDEVEEEKEEATTTPYENPLLIHLFTDCRLVERILDAWEENDCGDNQNVRKGFMGHLTKIANVMVQHASRSSEDASGLDDLASPSSASSLIAQQMQLLPEKILASWGVFVSGKLADINERNTIVPASTQYANTLSGSEDDDTEFRDLQFPQESALQQMFSDYQMQQMSENFDGSFGINEEEFNDDDDSPNNSHSRRPTNVSFDTLGEDIDVHEDDFDGDVDADADGNLSAKPKKRSADEMFEAVCDERIDTLGLDGDDKDADADDADVDADADPWEQRTKQIEFGPGVADAESPSASTATADAENKKMEVDEAEEEEEGSASAGAWPVAMDTGNPWESLSNQAVASVAAVPVGMASSPSMKPNTSSTPPDDGWADFGFGKAQFRSQQVADALLAEADGEAEDKDKDQEEEEEKGEAAVPGAAATAAAATATATTTPAPADEAAAVS